MIRFAIWALYNGCFKNGTVTTDGLIKRLGRGFPLPEALSWRVWPRLS